MTNLQTYGHSALQALNATFSKEQADTLLSLLAAVGGGTITIDDVDGLESRLSAIEDRLEALEPEE